MTQKKEIAAKTNGLTIERFPVCLPRNWSAPAEFNLVDIGVRHPRTGMSGVLLRNIATGVYVLDQCGSGVYMSVPQDWAAHVASESGYIGAHFA